MASQADRVTFTEIFNLSVEMIGRNFRLLALFGLGAGLAIGMSSLLGPGGGLIAMAVQIVATYQLTIALLKREGFFRQDARVGNFGSYLGASILAAIGMAFGLVLFILPGLILLARWWLAPAIAIAENCGFNGALSRSWEATRPSQWSLVGFITLFGLIYFALLGATGASATGAAALLGGTPGNVGFEIVTNVIAMLFSGGGQAMAVALLRRLRRPTAMLDEIFS